MFSASHMSMRRGRGGTMGATAGLKSHILRCDFCLLPLSAQRPASGGYRDGERGQWNRHHSLLATPSRRGAEWGGPGVQGSNNNDNNKKKRSSLMSARVGLVLWRRTKEMQTRIQADQIRETMRRQGKVMNSWMRHTFVRAAPLRI